jgi:hypothetical protein
MRLAEDSDMAMKSGVDNERASYHSAKMHRYYDGRIGSIPQPSGPVVPAAGARHRGLFLRLT